MIGTTISKYPKIALLEERRLIALAQKGSQKSAEEIILRHIGFVIFRIHKRAFPEFLRRFGEDLLFDSIPILHQKIKTYNLKYRDNNSKMREEGVGFSDRFDAMNKAFELIQKEKSHS